MNDDEIREVEHEADRLHFKSALQLLQKTRRTETDDTDWHRLMARILRGLSDSRAALDHAETPVLHPGRNWNWRNVCLPPDRPRKPGND